MTTQRVRDYCREEANRFGTTAGDVLSSSRRPVTVMARVAVMRRLRNEGFSAPQIGAWMNRDHFTVLHHLKGQ